jgi:hypothetical protein
MKRTAARIASACLTFILGTTASSLWQYYKTPQVSPSPVTVAKPLINQPTATPIVTAPPAPVSEPEVVVGGGLKVVSNEVQLENELLHYRVSVTYPQLEGTTALPIRNFNKHIEQLASKQYQWILNPSREDLRYYKQKHPEAFNTLSLDYEVVLASDSFLSIYFKGYGYGIGAAHAVQYSFVINYDFAANRFLKLSDIFKPGAKYLKFISEYCIDQLSRGEHGNYLSKDNLAPMASNFESWNLTKEGIRFNFDACRLLGCADGEQTVEIPFTALREMMSIR